MKESGNGWCRKDSPVLSSPEACPRSRCPHCTWRKAAPLSLKTDTESNLESGGPLPPAPSSAQSVFTQFVLTLHSSSNLV